MKRKKKTRPEARPETKPCAACGKPLKSVFEDWDTKQPSDGGEIRLLFSYGSKFDECWGPTEFNGFICDECAEKMVGRMDKTLYDLGPDGTFVARPGPSDKEA